MAGRVNSINRFGLIYGRFRMWPYWFVAVLDTPSLVWSYGLGLGPGLGTS